MSKQHQTSSIRLSISDRIANLSDELQCVGNQKLAAEATRLAEAVSFLESEIGKHQAVAIFRPHHIMSAETTRPCQAP